MNSQCQTVKDRFSAYWEKGLSPSEAAEMKRHLDSCPSCKEEYSRFGQTLRLLHSMDEMEVPDGFLTGVNTKVDEGRERSVSPEKLPPMRTLRPLSWRLPAEAIAMVTLVFLALYLTQNRSSDISPKEETRLSQPSLPAGKKAKDEGTSSERDDSSGRNRTTAPEPDSKTTSAQEDRVPKSAKQPVIREASPLQKADGAPAAPQALAPPIEKQAADQVFAAKGEKKEEGRVFQEYILKSTNAEETSKQVLDLVKRLEGEILSSGQGAILVAVPGAALAPFHEGLEEIGKSPDRLKPSAIEMRPSGEGADQIGRRKEAERKGKSPSLSAGRDETVFIRIVIQVLSREN